MRLAGSLIFLILIFVETMWSPGTAQQACPGWRDPQARKLVGGVGGKNATLQHWPSQAGLRLT
jgi:hypothetical protein